MDADKDPLSALTSLETRQLSVFPLRPLKFQEPSFSFQTKQTRERLKQTPGLISGPDLVQVQMCFH